MNLLSIVICMLFLVLVWIGYIRGFLKSAFIVGSGILALILTFLLSPMVSATLTKETKLDTVIQKKIEETLKLNTKKDVTTKVKQTEAIEQLHLPELLQNGLIENNHEEIYEALHIEHFYEYVAAYFTLMIMNAISFLLTYVIVRIILIFLGQTLEFITELPIVHTFDKVGGVALGFIEALLLTWIFFVIVTMFIQTEFGKIMIKEVNQSVILSYLYNNNLLLESITNLSKIVF